MIDSSLQLAVAALVAIVIFFGAFSASQKVAATVLLLLIPFQPVETRFFSANTLATYGVFIALLLRGSEIRLPMLPQIGVLLLCYLLSMALVHPSTYMQHTVYMVALVSAVLVLWIAYDLTVRHPNKFGAINLLIWMNVLIVVYCSIQLIMGPGTKLVFFNNPDFALMPVRRDSRLTGPFGAAGIAAEYFVIMIYVVGYQLLSIRGGLQKNALLLLITANMLLLIATGNRGGFLTLIGAGLVFLWLFRMELGPKRVVGVITIGPLLLIIAAAIAIQYTDFGRLFDRLVATEVEAGIPDTRLEVWPNAVREVRENLFFGHGPRLRFDGGDVGQSVGAHPYIRYPHNLYLFLALTVGVIGLAGFLLFLIWPVVRSIRLIHSPFAESYYKGIAKLGIVLMTVIFVDQMKVSFMRMTMVDYWHFIFALIGILIGYCDRALLESAQSAPAYRREAGIPVNSAN